MKANSGFDRGQKPGFVLRLSPKGFGLKNVTFRIARSQKQEKNLVSLRVSGSNKTEIARKWVAAQPRWASSGLKTANTIGLLPVRKLAMGTFRESSN